MWHHCNTSRIGTTTISSRLHRYLACRSYRICAIKPCPEWIYRCLTSSLMTAFSGAYIHLMAEINATLIEVDHIKVCGVIFQCFPFPGTLAQPQVFRPQSQDGTTVLGWPLLLCVLRILRNVSQSALYLTYLMHKRLCYFVKICIIIRQVIRCPLPMSQWVVSV